VDSEATFLARDGRGARGITTASATDVAAWLGASGNSGVKLVDSAAASEGVFFAASFLTARFFTAVFLAAVFLATVFAADFVAVFVAVFLVTRLVVGTLSTLEEASDAVS
jgi:hypothetical protein